MKKITALLLIVCVMLVIATPVLALNNSESRYQISESGLVAPKRLNKSYPYSILKTVYDVSNPTYVSNEANDNISHVSVVTLGRVVCSSTGYTYAYLTIPGIYPTIEAFLETVISDRGVLRIVAD